GYGTNDVARVVFDFGQGSGHGTVARLVAARRHVLIQRLMRALEIVDGAPSIEDTLCLAKRAEALQSEYLGFEGSVEALVFAAGLGVIWPAVKHVDAEL